jgi:protein-S-isoprenylcysteine O-methyltransferase Ste14
VLAAAVCASDMDGRGVIAWPIGLALFIGGWALRIWAQRHVRYRLKARKAITTCGPYAYVRNPIYLANASMGLGAVAASAVAWMLPVTLLWYAIVYTLAVAYEEQRLVRQYGQAYGVYRQSVHPWMPHLPRHRASCPHHGLARVLLAELHTPLMMAPATMKALHVVLPLGLRRLHLA